MIFGFGKKIIAECGHPIRGRRGKVQAFGEEVTTTIPEKNDGKFEYCHKCLGEMAILCAWCGEPIFVGDSVTLYSPTDRLQFEKIKSRPSVAVYDEEKMQLVGCGRRTCADTGMDYCGTWVPPGKVLRWKSVTEKLMENPDAKAAISHDVHNPDATEIIK